MRRWLQPEQHSAIWVAERVAVPFERVAIDLVGPLLKSAWDHKYILVIMDYTTCYLEAVPLWKAMSKNISRELVFVVLSHG